MAAISSAFKHEFAPVGGHQGLPRHAGMFASGYSSFMQENSVAMPGRRWPAMPIAVLVLCFLFNFLGRGIGDTFMVFLLPLGAEFGWQRSQLTSVYSALMVTSGLAAPLAGLVFERWGPRMLYSAGLLLLGGGYFLASRAHSLWQFYACVSVLGGLGAAALGMVPVAALLSRWYTRHMGAAIGLAYAGFGCGSLVLVPLSQSLIVTQGWRPTYQVLGGGLLLLVPLVQWLPWRAIRAGGVGSAGSVGNVAGVGGAGHSARPAVSVADHRGPIRSAAADAASTVAAPGAAAAGQRGAITASAALRRALHDRRFWLLVQVMFFTALGMYLVIVQSVAYLIDVGFTPLQAASAFGAAGMLSVLGVSSAGWLADRFGHPLAIGVSFSGTALGMGLLWALSQRASPLLLMGYVLVFGLCQGARGPVIAGLSARLFAGPGQATVYGAIYACMSVGSGVGALLSGVLHDLTGGYGANFALALLSVLLAALPFLFSAQRLRVPPLPTDESHLPRSPARG